MVYVPVSGDDYDPDDPSIYDERHFYTTETGTETLRVRVSSRVARAVVEVVNQPNYVHYRTPSDFLRDAVIHRLHYLSHELSDPVVRQILDALLNDEREHAVILGFEERAKAEEKEATIIASRYWKTTDGSVRLSMARRAKKLVLSGLLDDNLKDGLRAVINHREQADYQKVADPNV